MQSTSPVEALINEQKSLVLIIRNWVPVEFAQALCEKLRTTIPWKSLPVKIHGQSIIQPRQIYACGEPGLIYRYSGLEIPVEPWIPEVHFYLQALEQALPGLLANVGVDLPTPDTSRGPITFDSCLLNEYQDGSQYIGYHSDKEAMGAYNTVLTVSLGGSRDFYFKTRAAPFRVIRTQLHNGDVCIMFGDCQKHFTHSIPKRAHGDYRISLTYRLINPPPPK